MPRIAVDDFLGPSNRQASPIADIEDTINGCLEPTAPGQAKTPGYHRKRPGLQPFLQTGTGGWIRGQITIDYRSFAVSGDQFGEVLWNGTVSSWISYGTVVDDDGLASMSTNGTEGHQIQICSGGIGYLFDLSTNAFATNVSLDPDFPANVSKTLFLKGWTIVTILNTSQFFISALFDSSSWDPLDTAIISDFAGIVNDVLVVRDTLRFLGNRQGESWYANGDPLFPFAPVPGSMVNVGTSSINGACNVANTSAYLSQDQFGNGIVRIDDGVETNRVSTHAIEYYLRQSVRVEDARLYSFQDQGHVFLVVWMTDLDTTPVYDLATQRWFKWARWNTTTVSWEPYIGACQTFAFGHQLIGSRVNDVIYDSSFNHLSDAVIS